MNIRNAKVSDVESIHSLVRCYAEVDRMLFLSISDVYENLRNFVVADMDGKVAGCCALKVIWADIAEIKSLAVAEGFTGKGIGKSLVEYLIQQAGFLGLPRVFTLTLEPVFFEKVGFNRIPMDSLPMKVWSDCAKCPKQDNCDEVALVYDLQRQPAFSRP